MKPMSCRVEGATVDGSEILQSPLGMMLKHCKYWDIYHINW